MAKGKNMAKTKRDGELAPARERGEKALRLRIAGATFGEIAAEADFRTAAEAALAVQLAAREMPEESPEDVYRMILTRLDAMLAAVWVAATEGDPAAIGTVLRIEERREHLLNVAEERARECARQPLTPEQLSAFGFSA